MKITLRYSKIATSMEHGPFMCFIPIENNVFFFIAICEIIDQMENLHSSIHSIHELSINYPLFIHSCWLYSSTPDITPVLQPPNTRPQRLRARPRQGTARWHRGPQRQPLRDA